MSKRKVLVIDDDFEFSKSMLFFLKMCDYETDIAVSCEDALRLVSEKRYDVALLDFRMPEMDGIHLFEQIKTIQPNLTAIMVTADIGEDGMHRSTEAGIFEVLHKPVRREDLITHIQRAAEQTLENEHKSNDTRKE